MDRIYRPIQGVLLLGGSMLGGFLLVFSAVSLEQPTPMTVALGLLPFLLAGLTGIAKTTTA